MHPLLALAVCWSYFALAMLQTRRLGIPMIKESVLPTLTYRPNDRTREYLKTLDNGPKAGLKDKDLRLLGLMHGKDRDLQLGMTMDSPSSRRKGRLKTDLIYLDDAKPFCG